jgi:alpha-glucoside transport system permease protein
VGVATSTDDRPATAAPEPVPGSASHASAGTIVLRIAAVLVGIVAAFFALSFVFNYLRDENANRFAIVAVAIVTGVGGVFFLFWAMNRAVNWLPENWREGVRPYVFVGPALVTLAVFLIYPVINTIIISFKDANSKSFVGWDNYKFVFTDESMLRSLRNTAGWVLLVPLVAVTIGLVFATLADRLRHGESFAKSMIFLPMAISFVGAAVTFRLIYSYRPKGFGTNIGLMNGVMIGLGKNPVPWLSEKPWNNLLLMVIMVWMQTGFAMVVLSAAIKAIPDEIIEAARIDGASEWQVFRNIIVPSILPTIVVVTTYMVINALKVFDIVFVMSSNAESTGTEVVAERMIRWFFISGHNGRCAAIAVVLFLAVIPVMVWNVRKFREQELTR